MRPPALPRTIACIGRNFADHIAELGNTRPREPFYFLKSPGSILYPHHGPVLIPKGCEVHHEVELGIIFGKTVDTWRGRVWEELVRDGPVKGFCVGIDMTSRTHQGLAKKSGLPWTLSKGMKTFLPVSNFIPLARIPNPQDVELYLEINGETKQRDNTNLMLFDIPRLVEHVSGVAPLFEDDLLFTGTPKGVGRINPGDMIVAGVRVNGEEVREGRIEVGVEERTNGYGSDAAMEE